MRVGEEDTPTPADLYMVVKGEDGVGSRAAAHGKSLIGVYEV